MDPIPSDRKRVTAWISGKVQGVFFRAWTKEQALGLGLTGWVRNLSDGNVEWVAEGSTENLKTLLKRCHQGPPASQVTRVKEQWQDPLGQFKDFRIRHD